MKMRQCLKKMVLGIFRKPTFQTDGANTVGALGANRPNKMYAKSLVQVGGAVDVTTWDSAHLFAIVGDGVSKKCQTLLLAIT
jgi:hypothetical protein